MASIKGRKKKDGTISYTAQIRIKQGSLTHTESKTLTDRKKLEHWVERREAELNKPGALEALKRAGVTVAEVFKWYEEDFDGKSKFGRSKMSSVRFLQDCPTLCDLDAVNLKASDLIAHARARAAGGTGGATINTDFVWLRNAFRSARLVRDVPVNLQAVDDAAALLRSERMIHKAKRRDRRPTLDELDRLLEYFAGRDGRASLPMVDITLFALFSGRRQEEICRLRWDDIDERRRCVMVRDMKHPREKTNTYVYFTDEAWAIAQRQPRDGDFIFPYNSKSVSSAFMLACKVTAIDDLRFHDLRHECVSWLFELGWDIPRVSNVSGHKSWSSLQRYTHIAQHEPHDKYAGWQWRPSKEEKKN